MLPTALEAQNPQSRPAWSHSNLTLTLFIVCIYLLCLHMVEGMRELSGVPFKRALIHEGSTHMIQSPPEAPPCGSNGKEPSCQCRRCRFSPWVRKILWRRKWQPTPVFLPGEPHGQRNLEDYGLWRHKVSDMTEQLSTAQHKLPQRSSPVAQEVNNLFAMQKMQVQSLGWADPLEKEIATHPSILA